MRRLPNVGGAYRGRYRALARVVAEGLVCAAREWVVEFHERRRFQSAVAAWRAAAAANASCTTSVEMDEESYMWDPHPLPPRPGAPADDPWATLNMRDHGSFWLHGMRPGPEGTGRDGMRPAPDRGRGRGRRGPRRPA